MSSDPIDPDAIDPNSIDTAPAQPPDEPAEQPVEQPAEPQADRRVGQAYLLLVVCVCLMLTVGSMVQAWSPYVGPAIIEIFFIFLPALLFVRAKRLPVAQALRWRPISAAGALLAILLGTGGYGVAVGIYLLTIPFIGRGPEIEFFQFETLPQLALTLFCCAVLPGICEETMFRGVVQSVLGRGGAVKSILITSTLFALFHFSPWNFLPPLFFGVVFGIVTLRSGSTVPTMIAHAATNSTAFTIGYLFHDEYDPRAQIVCAALAAGFVVGFPIYLLKTRHQPTEPEPLASVPAGLSKRQRRALAKAGSLFFVGLVFLFVLGIFLRFRG